MKAALCLMPRQPFNLYVTDVSGIKAHFLVGLESSL